MLRNIKLDITSVARIFMPILVTITKTLFVLMLHTDQPNMTYLFSAYINHIIVMQTGIIWSECSGQTYIQLACNQFVSLLLNRGQTSFPYHRLTWCYLMVIGHAPVMWFSCCKKKYISSREKSTFWPNWSPAYSLYMFLLLSCFCAQAISIQNMPKNCYLLYEFFLTTKTDLTFPQIPFIRTNLGIL